MPGGNDGAPRGADEELTTPPVDAASRVGEAGRVARLGAYFRANRARFTIEALKRAAATAGYSARDIEAAWASTGWGSAEPSASHQSRVLSAAAAVTFVVGYYGVGLLLAFNALSGPASLAGLVGLVGGVVAWAMLRESNPALARGIGCGVVLVVLLPIVLFLVILGICVATGTTYPL
jgi:hypothetical protein